MANLMAQHCGQLRLGIEVVQQAAMDVDVAATRREGVDLVVIEHEEPEVPIGDGCLGGNLCADTLDVVLYGLVFVQAVELDDFLVNALGLILLALHRGEDDVVATRCGIRSAGRR